MGGGVNNDVSALLLLPGEDILVAGRVARTANTNANCIARCAFKLTAEVKEGMPLR